MSAASLALDLKGMEPDDVLKRMMFAVGAESQSELAGVLGVRRAAVTDAKRRGRLPAEWFLRLCRQRQINPVWLETGLGPQRLADPVVRAEPGAPCEPDEFAYVPKVAAVPRMGPEGLETGEEVQSYYAFRRDWLSRIGRGTPKDLRLMTVAGDSMEPTLHDSDVVLVDQKQREIVFGKIYVVGIDDGIVVKRLDKKPGKLVLVSDNRHTYPPLEIDLNHADNVRVIGRVVWMSREVR